MAVRVQPKDSYFQKFIDNTRLQAESVGRKEPSWVDVWLAALQTSEMIEVLAKRGIDLRGLQEEILYADRFTRIFSARSQSQNGHELILQARAELVRDLRAFQMNRSAFGQEGRNPLVSGAMGSAVASEMIRFVDRIRVGDDTDEARMRHQIKVRMVKLAAEKIIPALASSFGVDDPDQKLESEVVDVVNDLLGHIISQIQVLDAAESKTGITKRIERLKTSPIEDPSALKVMDFIIEESGPVFTQLMHRNGLRYTEVPPPDALADALPSKKLQAIFNMALRIAYELNATELNARHITLALLRQSSVQLHMRKLGIKNLMEFEDKFRDECAEMDKKLKGDVSMHPTIPLETSMLMQRLCAAYDEKQHYGHLLHTIVLEDTAIDKAMNKAGLRRRMMRSWKAQYDRDYKEEERDPDKKDKKSKKDDKPKFKVDDLELERAIEEYTTDFTALARKKKFDPLIGNEDAIDTIATKLLKKGKKNPVVVAAAGVGKTKVLEGFAQAVVSGKVPDALVGSRVLSLNLHRMNDTPYIGVFEGRILTILEGVAERNALGTTPPIILEIDELAGALKSGGHSFSPGFQGIVKPFLTSGDILMVSATTDDEYRKTVDADPALARRMPPVFLKEPTVEQTGEILKGLRAKYRAHHHVRVPDHMLGEIATSAHRYIRSVANPDKAIDLMDEACAIAQKKGDRTLQKSHLIEALSGMTNIPVHFFAESDEDRYANLGKTLNRRVLDQSEAVDAVAAALKRARAGLKDPETPVGNFLFLGPTGVGKTELSRALAELLFGSADDFFTRFDMSEFADRTAISRFLGGNPNYVGYEQGGLLVKTLRSKPFGVYLYDEAEKADREVYNALLAPFSNGVVTDGRGVSASMRDAVNILTSNLGAQEVNAEAAKRKIDAAQAPEEWEAMARPIFMAAAQGYFRPEFLNRMDAIIPFRTLSQKTVEKLVRREMQTTEGQLQNRHGLELEIAPVFLQLAAKKGFDPQKGARPLKRAWADVVTTPMAAFILDEGVRARAAAKKIIMEVDDGSVPSTLAEPMPIADATVVSLASVAQARRRPTYDMDKVRPRFRYA